MAPGPAPRSSASSASPGSSASSAEPGPLGPLPELNEPQAQAVAHADGPLLIFAGAGSGKTRVIVYRIATLVAVRRVAPYKILAVTFTNKAAGEMKRRLEGLIGADVTKDLWVGTFHAICARLLRRHHEAAGLQRNFLIYDDADQRAVMGRLLKELELDDRRYPPRQVLARIHAEKQEGRAAKDFTPEGYLDDAIAKCFAGYERALKAANAVDFDDLLLAVLRIVEDKESLVGEELRRRFRYVLVDEFQDVNQVQYRLVKGFAHDHQNLCVVGDDDQSIYRWRGADVRIVRGFRRDFPGATVVKLEQNYRSTQNIVQGALGVIKQARDREPKELWTQNAGGEPIDVVATDNEHDEAAFVADKVREATRGGVSAGEIAVFYRTHAQSRVLEEVMRKERIPYQIIGGMRFFERAEVKDVLSYLRLVDNPRSDVDLLRVINVPSRKIGQTTIDRLTELATREGLTAYEALEPVVTRGGLATAAKKSIVGFRDLVQTLMRCARDADGPAAFAEQVLVKTGYQAMLQDDESAEAEARLQNLRELVGAIADYEDEARAAGEEPTLSGYLERVTLSSDTDALEDAPRVAMMTVHGAKGLEFDTVFLTGMEEDLFPFRSQDPKRGEDDEEERRLAYVAVTRARRRLFITHAGRRTLFGTLRYGLPSRFLADLPKASVRSSATATMASQRFSRPDSSLGAFASRARGAWATPATQAERPAWTHPQERAPAVVAARRPEPERAPGERYVEREPQPAEGDGTARRGARVEHPKFGRGVLVAMDGGDDPVATVRFSGRGEMRIKASFLRIL